MTLICDNLVPFNAQGRVDTGALRAHVLWLVAHGVDGFFPAASEFLHVDNKEKEQIIEVVADAAPGCPLLICAWDPSPTRAIRIGEAAAAHGARALVVPPPLFTPVPDTAMIEWYRVLKRNLPLPVLAWHNPRFGNDLSTATLDRLCTKYGLEGWVDASGDPFRVRRLASAHPGRTWASSDEAPAVAEIDGLAGVVSRLANVYPDLAVRLFEEGDKGVAEAVSQRLQQLTRAGGIGAMKRLLGMQARLPIVGADEAEMMRLPPTGFV